jgi:hypothetical protein
MKRVVFLAFALFLAWSNCIGQTGKKEAQKPEKANQPQKEINVNKVYDENGSIIGYDSTYSYSFSYPGNFPDTLLIDSIFNDFRSHFGRDEFPFSDPFFDDHFLNDSLFYHDFFRKDFFYNQFPFYTERMKKLFQELDSLKNRIQSEQFRRLGYPEKGLKL